MITQFRFIGWWFLILGSIMLVSQLADLFDPNATMLVDGVPTNKVSAKLVTAAIVSIGPILGAFLAFIPKPRFAALLEKFQNFAKDFVTRHRQ